MTRLMILVSIILTCFSSNALAYLKDYPPYQFEDGPPDHLKIVALIDSSKSEYVSRDGKTSASLKKTKSGIVFQVKDDGVVLISKKSKKLPLPYALYQTDIDGNGLNDFIVFYNYRDWFRNGIKEDMVEIFLKKSEGAYQKIAYDTISVGLEDFVDLNGDGIYEVIITKMDRIKRHNYFIYNIYEFDSFRLLNSDAKFKGFSKFIRYFLRPNDNDDLNISRKERLTLSDSNNKAVQQKAITSEKTPAVVKPKKFVGIEAGELGKELPQKSEAIKALEDKEQKLMAQIEDYERKFQEALISERNNQKMLEVRVEELSDKLVVFEKYVKVLKEENRNLQAVIETRETEFQETIANIDMKHQEALMTKIKELSERLVLNADAIRALKDKDLELEYQFQGKEVEFQEVLAAKDKEQRDGLEDRIEELSDKLVVLERNMKIREEENQRLKSRLETRENDLQEALVIKDRNQKEIINNRFIELSDRFALLEKNMNALEEDGQIMQGKLETKVEELAEVVALKDKTIEKLKDGEQGLRVELENIKVGFQDTLDVKDTEHKEALKTKAEELSDKLLVFEKNMKVLGERDQHLESRLEANERTFQDVLTVKDREYQELSDYNDAKLLDINKKMALKNEALKELKEKEQHLKAQFKGKEEELQQTIAAKGRKHQEVLEARVEKLSDKLTGFEMTIQALKEEDQNLQTRLETKDKEYQDEFVAKDIEFHAFLEGKIKKLSEEWLKSLGSLSEEKSLVNVGAVDIQRVIEESRKGREARMFFEGLVSLRSEEELTKTEQKLISEIIKDIEVMVQKYAKEHGITYIVDGASGGVVYINKRLDITDEIIDLYNETVDTSK